MQWALKHPFEKIVLTTDIPDLLKTELDERVIKLERAEALSGDKTRMRDVVLDVIKRLSLSQNAILWVLQPSSPFRKDEDFKAIDRLIYSSGIRSVISGTEVGANHPDRMFTIRNGWLKPLRHHSFDNKEDLAKEYIRNGCYYVVRSSDFRSTHSFLVHPCAPYLMDAENSINIDSMMDLELARLLHAKAKHTNTV